MTCNIHCPKQLSEFSRNILTSHTIQYELQPSTRMRQAISLDEIASSSCNCISSRHAQKKSLPAYLETKGSSHRSQRNVSLSGIAPEQIVGQLDKGEEAICSELGKKRTHSIHVSDINDKVGIKVSDRTEWPENNSMASTIQACAPDGKNNIENIHSSLENSEGVKNLDTLNTLQIRSASRCNTDFECLCRSLLDFSESNTQLGMPVKDGLSHNEGNGNEGGSENQSIHFNNQSHSKPSMQPNHQSGSDIQTESSVPIVEHNVRESNYSDRPSPSIHFQPSFEAHRPVDLTVAGQLTETSPSFQQIRPVVSRSHRPVDLTVTGHLTETSPSFQQIRPVASRSQSLPDPKSRTTAYEDFEQYLQLAQVRLCVTGEEIRKIVYS